MISKWVRYCPWNRAACQSLGGDLVSIETEEEWNFICNEVQTTLCSRNRWNIGLIRKAGNWTWVNGRPLTICKWGEGQPSGHSNMAHISKQSSNGTWGIFDGNIGLSCYICEIPKGKKKLSILTNVIYQLFLLPEALRGNKNIIMLAFFKLTREVINLLKVMI